MSLDLEGVLLPVLRAHFALDWDGIHGIGHWRRVRDNGLRLAAATGARPRVVELFGYLHDSMREDDGYDLEHGPRAARFVRTLAGDVFHLPADELDLLADAIDVHSHGYIDGDVTVQTCWDADRLDLGRIGIVPNPRRLCTPAAREPAMIEWAYRRSLLAAIDPF
jgi:uncharacterized protein